MVHCARCHWVNTDAESPLGSKQGALPSVTASDFDGFQQTLRYPEARRDRNKSTLCSSVAHEVTKRMIA